MPTSHNLYLGGSHLASSQHMQPGALDTAAYPFQYPNSLKTRGYQVARVLDFRPLNPVGGLDVRVDAQDRDWLDNLAVAPAVNDILRLIYLPKFTRLVTMQAFIIAGEALLSLTFGLEVGGVFTANSLATLGATNGANTTAVLGTEVTTNDTYVAAKIIALPTNGVLNNIRFAAQAEVIEWGSGFGVTTVGDVVANES